MIVSYGETSPIDPTRRAIGQYIQQNGDQNKTDWQMHQQWMQVPG
jgi:hypothetical protein